MRDETKVPTLSIFIQYVVCILIKRNRTSERYKIDISSKGRRQIIPIFRWICLMKTLEIQSESLRSDKYIKDKKPAYK
jgi:hypothetical protein